MTDALVFLVNNAALLLALGVLYDFLEGDIAPRLALPERLRLLVVGVFLGLIGVVVIRTSWTFAPGIIFDTRSVVLSLAGLFFGWVPALIAAGITATYRLLLGGLGAKTGAAVAIMSALIGLAWRRWRPSPSEERSYRELYLFGLVVHVNMILWMFTLPWPVAQRVVAAIALPVLLVYPVVTMLFGRLLVQQERRRRMYRLLRESEERYRSLFEHVPVGLYRSTPDGRLLDVNATLVEMLGYPDKATLLAVQVKDVYADPDEREKWQAAVERARDVCKVEYRLRRWDGSIIWVRDTARIVRDTSGRVIYYEGALEDITAQKAAEEERSRLLRELQQRAELVTRLLNLAATFHRPQSVPEVIAAIGRAAKILSGADRVAIYVREGDAFTCAWRHNLSESYVRTVLENIERLPGRSFFTRTDVLYISDSHEWPEDSLFRQIADKEGYRALAVWPLIYEERTIAAVACYYNAPHTWNDIEREVMLTFSHKAAIALRNAQLLETVERANAELREALQAREDMLRNVTHELRTPLTLARGYAELLLDSQSVPPDLVREAADVILRNARHLEHLIEQLLAFQRLDRDLKHRTRFDVAPWLREVLSGWRPALAEAGLDLRLDIREPLGKIEGQRDYLNQVLYNLLDNARKFSPRGGTVTVRAWADERWVYISVRDEGVGIPPEKLDRIFERFYQVDPSTTRRFGGMGLGLALVKEIVERHGGRVWAESQGTGKGARFTVVLPRAD